MDNKLNLVRGSLIGGAAGDALGYAVEFDRYSEIIAKYERLSEDNLSVWKPDLLLPRRWLSLTTKPD